MLFPTLFSILALGCSPALGFTTKSFQQNAIGLSKATSLNMVSWSDSKAVKEYQEFLDTGRLEPERKRDGPSVIIKPTDAPPDLATAIASLGMGDDVVLTPFMSLPPELDGSPEYPIYITLPPHQIEPFLMNLPEEYAVRSDDFVFFSGGLQCGNIEDVLKEFGYCRDSMTQVLVSGIRLTPAKTVVDVSVKLGLDSNGEQKYAGECTACGKWNGAIAERMLRSNIRCRMDFYREWRRLMWERSVYDAVFNLCGVVRSEPTTISQVANYYGDEVSEIMWEISSQLRGWKALSLSFGFEERTFGVAEANGDGQQPVLDEFMYPFIWGNKVFLESKTYLSYLHFAQKEVGLLQSVQLPELKEDTRPSIMRKGNLRADGVV